MHAGARESVLTVLDTQTFEPIPHQVSVATQAFGKALNATLSTLALDAKPDLVLLGDALDFSLSNPAISAEILAGFLGSGGMDVAQNFQNIQFLPGNHDHSLWTAERYGATTGDNPDPTHPSYWAHTSPAFEPAEKLGTTTALNHLLKGIGYNKEVATYYPNMGLLPQSKTQDPPRATVLHHGHFIESAYRMMTDLLATLTGTPVPEMTVENLETINGSWIDFAWSTIGDNGALGAQVSISEQILLTGGAAHALQDHLASLLATEARRLLPIPRSDEMDNYLKMTTRAAVDQLIGAYSQVERYNYTEPLSAASQKGLAAYIGEAVVTQMRQELKACELPEDLTFIFGHTHKPFADRIVVDGWKRPVSIYNTGGWVLDTALRSTVEGAGICFVDDAGNTAMIELYMMGQSGDITSARVISSDPNPDDKNPLFIALHKAVDANAAAWDDFTRMVELDITIKQDMYLAFGDDAENAYLRGGKWQ